MVRNSPEITGVCQNETSVLHVQLTPSGQRSRGPPVKKKKVIATQTTSVVVL